MSRSSHCLCVFASFGFLQWQKQRRKKKKIFLINVFLINVLWSSHSESGVFNKQHKQNKMAGERIRKWLTLILGFYVNDKQSVMSSQEESEHDAEMAEIE